jgi:hypothetical protein
VVSRSGVGVPCCSHLRPRFTLSSCDERLCRRLGPRWVHAF